MRRLIRSFAVITLLVAAVLLPMNSALAGGPVGGKAPVNKGVRPTWPNNKVPSDVFIEDTHAAEQAASLKIKEERAAASSAAALSSVSSVPLTTDPPLSDPLIIAGPGVNQLPCTAWCGPAATQVIFYSKSDTSHSLEEIAGWEKSGDCTGGATCILNIRDALNQHLPGLPWPNYYVGVRLNHDSLNAAALNLQNIEHWDLGHDMMEFIVLLQTNPPDGTIYKLEGYGPNYIHYITINGYAGTYDGSDESAVTYYHDSWQAPEAQHRVSLNCMADCIKFNDGLGSCSGNTDVVY